MDLRLQGKHVLVTGGSRGIGFACAQEFLREGCTVSIVGRDPQRLEESCAALDPERQRASGFAADLTNPAEALRVIDQAEHARGPVDILVNSAGAARQKPFAELQPEDWRAAMDVKFLTYINVMDPLVKRMASRGGGSVVNIAGMGGKLPITTHLAGGAANAALMLASAGLALAYGSRGVRVNALNPSGILTERLAAARAAKARQRDSSADMTLLHARETTDERFGTPEDVAAAVVFLASPRASYISGAILSMDGASRPMVV